MRRATSAEVPDIEASLTTQLPERVAQSSDSTNSRPALELTDPLPSEHPRWRWDRRAKKWNVQFQGHNWIIGSAEDSHVWFLADIHRLNLFTQLTKVTQ
jgi:hypothetical protein